VSAIFLFSLLELSRFNADMNFLRRQRLLQIAVGAPVLGGAALLAYYWDKSSPAFRLESQNAAMAFIPQSVDETIMNELHTGDLLLFNYESDVSDASA